MQLVKVYGFQMCRAIAYIHALGVCHRDIKPQNLLVDPASHVLKLCDFGSAKMLAPGESNIAYICSRYYRAPELIFGATEYTSAIDIWSVGCVLAELIIGRPLFAGESGVDQLVEIIKVGSLSPQAACQICTFIEHSLGRKCNDWCCLEWRNVHAVSIHVVLDVHSFVKLRVQVLAPT